MCWKQRVKAESKLFICEPSQHWMRKYKAESGVLLSEIVRYKFGAALFGSLPSC